MGSASGPGNGLTRQQFLRAGGATLAGGALIAGAVLLLQLRAGASEPASAAPAGRAD